MTNPDGYGYIIIGLIYISFSKSSFFFISAFFFLCQSNTFLTRTSLHGLCLQDLCTPSATRHVFSYHKVSNTQYGLRKATDTSIELKSGNNSLLSLCPGHRPSLYSRDLAAIHVAGPMQMFTCFIFFGPKTCRPPQDVFLHSC